MWHRKIFILLYMFFLSSFPLHSYRLLYREQLYELYHVHLYQYPERIAENIYWLEQALRADFANPLYALAHIKNKKEWEWYRIVFTMHINLKLVELYLRWGSKYMKFEAYFYNAPWKKQNLESLEKAEKLIRYAKVYWSEAKKYSTQAGIKKFKYLHIQEMQYWEDEHYRIQQGELDYEKIIDKHLRKLTHVRETFLSFDENTY